MRPGHVPNDDLSLDDVPDPRAPWEEIAGFAHTFHAYKVAGSVQRVSRLASEDAEAWHAGGGLPDDLTRLRLDLFATLRSLGSQEPDEATERWVRALAEAIREHLRS